MADNTTLKPGWLQRQMQAATPPDVLTTKQQHRIESIILRIGIREYRRIKQAAGVPLDVSIRRLSRWQASAIIEIDVQEREAES